MEKIIYLERFSYFKGLSNFLQSGGTFESLTQWSTSDTNEVFSLAFNTPCLECSHGLTDNYHWITFKQKKTLKNVMFVRFWINKGYLYDSQVDS